MGLFLPFCCGNKKLPSLAGNSGQGREHCFRGTTLVRPAFAGRALRAGILNNVPARRGNGRTRRRLEKKTPLRPRGSETIFHSARPARFHPPGFLSGADGVYSSRQSRFAVWVQRGRTFPLHLLPIIRKNSGFVNIKSRKPLTDHRARQRPAKRLFGPDGQGFLRKQESSPFGGK